MKKALKDAFYELIPEAKQQMFDTISEERTRYLTVALENIYQEHNASAVVRTCDCFGIQELHVIESKNKYKVQRDIARGAGQWVEMFHYNEGENVFKDCFQKLRKDGYKIAALTPDANAFSINNLPLDVPVALVFGTEWEGISDEIREEADYLVSIPMYGFTESFNVSVSVALTLQALRRRLELSDLDWKLSEEEVIDTKIRWCEKYMNRGNKIRKELEMRILSENEKNK